MALAATLVEEGAGWAPPVLSSTPVSTAPTLTAVPSTDAPLNPDGTIRGAAPGLGFLGTPGRTATSPMTLNCSSWNCGNAGWKPRPGGACGPSFDAWKVSNPGGTYTAFKSYRATFLECPYGPPGFCLCGQPGGPACPESVVGYQDPVVAAVTLAILGAVTGGALAVAGGAAAAGTVAAVGTGISVGSKVGNLAGGLAETAALTPDTSAPSYIAAHQQAQQPQQQQPPMLTAGLGGSALPLPLLAGLGLLAFALLGKG
jgi:hypothetical protein